MKLIFCPKCGIPLEIKEELGEFFCICKKCGLKEKTKSKIISKEGIVIDSKGKGFVRGNNKMANYDNICKKCGFDKAQIIDVGILYSDEDNLILLRCGRCGFSERIGRKVS